MIVNTRTDYHPSELVWILILASFTRKNRISGSVCGNGSQERFDIKIKH